MGRGTQTRRSGLRQRRLGVCVAALYLALAGAFAFIPSRLPKAEYSAVLYSKTGELLNAKVAADGQWRFPSSGEVSDRYFAALVQFEDRRFHWHPGVDLFAIGRAALNNWRAGRVVSGGSTLTMQLVRMSRMNPPRTYAEKAWEILVALRLDYAQRKADILREYSARAPFGGNVVGIEAASWRMFGHSASELSWGEASLLAVLPNAPGSVRIDRNREQLRSKRDRLLYRLHSQGLVSAEQLTDGLSESIPEGLLVVPDSGSHFMFSHEAMARNGVGLRSSLDAETQRQVQGLVDQYSLGWQGRGVSHAAAVVAEVQSGRVLAYVGNSRGGQRSPGDDVDIVRAPRSSGSTLKPFLFEAMLQEGELLPGMLLEDVPASFAGFAPENFSRRYDGAVPARDALARSLNVPAVHLLRDYGVDAFHARLQGLGFASISRPAAHYGLSLILGGAEVTLWELANAYARFAQIAGGNLEGPDLWVADDTVSAGGRRPEGPSTGSSYLTAEALLDVKRPGFDGRWKEFSSKQKIGWKTGTSHGFRDAWAIGFTPEHVVAVWLGNADGEGKAGLTGLNAAAPLLFALFEVLPDTDWYSAPASLQSIEVCAHSGMLAGPYCEERVRKLVGLEDVDPPICGYCKHVHLDRGGEERVNANCARTDEMRNVGWFQLPPMMAHYFKQSDAAYRELPDWKEGCSGEDSRQDEVSIIVPRDEGMELFLPRQLDGELGRIIFQAVHRREGGTIYWHLDEEFVGSTRTIHHLALAPAPGSHRLTLVSDHGEVRSRSFLIRRSE